MRSWLNASNAARNEEKRTGPERSEETKRENRKQSAGSWLPDMDLNHDKQIQSLLCYRYTIGQ